MTQSIKVVLRNPLDYQDQLDYNIVAFDTELSADWILALKGLLKNNNLLEKNYCFMGFPQTARTLEYLCNDLTQYIDTINNFFPDYQITETYTPDTVRGFDLSLIHISEPTRPY